MSVDKAKKETKSSGGYLAALDGVRTLSSYSIVFLHVLMYMTLTTRDGSDGWKTLFAHPFYRLMGVLSFSVDVFFALSGLLLTRSLLNQFKQEQTLSQFLSSLPSLWLNRALRLWPILLVSTALCFIYGNSVITIKPWWLSYLGYIFFFLNWLPAAEGMSWQLGPAWSLSVDFHFYLIFPLVFYLCYRIRRVLPLSLSLLGLLGLSVYIVMLKFHPTKANFVYMADCQHVNTLLATGTQRWMAEYYSPFPFSFTEPSCVDALDFMDIIYSSFLARYGPFILGALVAVSLESAYTSPVANSWWRRGLGWILSVVCVGILIMPALPPSPEPLPLDVQMYMTATLRQVFVSAVCFFTYCALVPKEHPFHSSFLQSFLSSNMFRTPAAISYAVYLLHFRLLGYLTYGPLATLALSSNHTVSILVIFVVGLTVSSICGYLVHVIIEKPFVEAASALLGKKKAKNE